jgi:hypothetical protein
MVIDSSGKLQISTGIIALNASDTFTLNGKTQPYNGFNLNGSASSPAAMNGYHGLVFGTASNERMRIDSSGNVFIGGTSAGTADIALNANGSATFSNTVSITSANNVFNLQSNRASGTTFALISGRGNSGADLNLIIWNNGNIQNANNSYGGLSDIKLKENIVDASSQWDDLKTIQVRNYNFIEGQTHTQIGVVAQEVETVSPGLVTESPDTDEEGNDLGTTTKSVNYSVLYMKAVKALQEAMTRIETLEQRLSDAGIA